MQETTAEVRRDIEETRARVSETLAELQSEVHGRKDAAVSRVTALRDGVTSAGTTVQERMADFAREHPWYALGTALGIGLLLGRSGVDEAAARATVQATKAAAVATGTGAAGAARAAVDKAKGLAHRGSDDAPAGAGVHHLQHDPATGAIGSSAEDAGQVDAVEEESGIVYRLGTGLVEAIGGDELLEDMRREAGRIGRG